MEKFSTSLITCGVTIKAPSAPGPRRVVMSPASVYPELGKAGYDIKAMIHRWCQRGQQGVYQGHCMTGEGECRL